MSDLLVLIDGSSYFYRAFHALPPLSNSQGQPTGAIYGVINMIKRLLKDYPPQYIAVVFDAKGKTFRDDLYVEYKANREAMPDDLSAQFAPMVEIIAAMGIPILTIDGVEADDVIGTLAHQGTADGLKTLISTGDKDMAQLVNDKVTLINTMNNLVLDPAGVVTKFGIKPEQMIDYLSLIGDKVDNVPGVPNVGPKTAVKWLENYGSLAGIIEHAAEISGKVGENLRTCLSQLPLAQQLVMIKTDVPLPLTPTDLRLQSPDHERLLELFKQFEFKNWLKELSAQQETLVTEQYSHYQTILTQTQLSVLLTQLSQCACFALDTETTDLNPLDAKLVGISIALESGVAAYIPLAHDYDNAPQQLILDEVLSQLKPILENPNIKKIAQNFKYDYSIFKNYNIEIQGMAYDTMLESYVLDSSANRHDMDTLALKFLSHKTISFADIAGKGAKQLTFNQVAIDKATHYAAEDADITWQLHQCLWPKLKREPQLTAVFQTLEMPLVKVLANMERHGVLIDVENLQLQNKQLTQRLNTLEQQVWQLAGESFNLNSPKQLQAILFEKLKLPVLGKTSTGQASTAEQVLSELAYDYPLPKVILEYRSLSKLLSTYVEALPKRINPSTGRVHTSYNQAVASTGRLSSSDPNLQNIPTRSEAGRQIRRAFIAPLGYHIVAADYSQIELRIMAHLSQDPALLKAFSNGWDIHTATAAEVLGIALDQVTPAQRRSAKAINFGLIYGMSSYGLAKQLDTSTEAAQQYIDIYFTRYPGVKIFMERTRESAHRNGYVETILGRRLYLPEINVRNLQRQRAAERMAINAPMQGTAADIIKKAMLDIDAWISKHAYDVTMVMQVHDELVFEVEQSQLALISKAIKELMEHAVQLDVPLEVSLGSGNNWEEAH